MTKSDMVTILREWNLAQTCADKGIDPLYQLFGCSPDAPVMDAFYRLAAAHTEVVSKLVGDDDGWLNWFQFDNKMGAKAFEASPPNGKVRKVRTLAHLAALIIESRPA